MKRKNIFARIAACVLAACTAFAAAPDGTITALAEETDDVYDDEYSDDDWDGDVLGDDDEYNYLTSNTRVVFPDSTVGTQLDYQQAKFTNIGTQDHDFMISCTNWDMWDIQVPNQGIISPGETLCINVRPDLTNSKWKEGDYSDVLTIDCFGQDCDTITDSAGVNLFVSVKEKAQPWVSYVDVYPGSVSLSQGQVYTFEADVEGGDGADLSVDWSIKGNSSSSTTISGGTLSIASNETSSNILVTATSRQDSSVKGTANVDIVKNQYTIGTQSSPTDGGSTSGGGAYNSGDQCTVVANTNNGYVFDGWYNGSNKVSSDYVYCFTVNGSQTLTAKFKQNTVYVKVKKNVDDGGTVSDNQNVAYGGKCTVKAKANKGYSFIGWYDGDKQLSSSEEYTMKNLTENKTVTAVFVQSQYTVALLANPSNGGTVSGGGTFKKGVDVTLVAKPASGYKFMAWVMNNQNFSTDSTCVIKNLDRDYSISALFQKENAKTYTVKVSTDTGHGTVSPSGGISVPDGKTIVVAISADADYNISDVKVDGKSVGSVSSYTFYNVACDHTLVASFTPAKKSSSSGVTGAGTTDSTKKSSQTSTVTGASAKATDTQAEDDSTSVIDVEDAAELSGTLEDLNVTPDEARELVEAGEDRPLMEMALYRGDLEVTVVNKYADDENETDSKSYYELTSVPNFSDVLDSVISEDEKIELFEGSQIRANLSIGGEDAEDVDSSEKSVFDQNCTSDGITLDSYFNIHFIKEVGGEPSLVTTLTEPLEIVMNVPDSMKGAEGELCVMRLHDGTFDVLPNESTDPDKIVFHTDKMSTFALGYYGSQGAAAVEAGEAKTSNTAGLSSTTGQKSNNAVIYIMLGIIIVGIAVIIVLAATMGRRRRHGRKR